jgi:plasmid stabilization system protein ParE
MRAVVFSSRARKNLEALLEYLEAEWSVSAKHAFIQKLDTAISIIAAFPESCPTSSL